MEPQIRYVKTSDGVSIAYAVVGEGPPVLFVSTMFGALHMASHSALFRQPLDQLVARGWRVIIYDQRGSGSSDRDCDDFSLEARLHDLEAVIDGAAPGERCVVLASLTAGPVGIAYAARCPDRVSHLVLRNAFADGATRQDSMLGLVVARALRPVLEDQWEFFALTLAHAMGGYEKSDQAREFAEAYRTGMTPQAYLAASLEVDRIDVTDVLASIHVPSLVVNDTGYLSVGVGWGPEARKLASRIPNARLVVTDDFPRALDDFLRGTSRFDVGTTAESVPSDTAVILFADIVDSTALTERMGDAGFRTASRALDEAMRAAMRETDGAPVDGKVLGDGVMGVFKSAARAIAAARRCVELSVENELQLHIGLHAGDVIRENDNVYGGAVNIASRICAVCEPGEILVSATIRELARTSAGVMFEDRGEHALKGIADAVRVYAVRKDAG